MYLHSRFHRTSLVIVFFSFITGAAQSQKQVIDEELLSSIVQAKQEEIKVRFLRNLVHRNIRTTNNATFNTMYDMVDILTTEKNSTRMTEALVHKAADYGVAYAATWHFITNTGPKSLTTKEKNPQTFNFSKDTFKEVKADYQTVRKEENDFAKVVTIDGKTPFRIGYVNWVLDEIAVRLRGKPGMNKIGLFQVDKERQWQTLYGPEYSAFWKAYDPDSVMVKDLLGELDGYVTKLDSGLVKLAEIAASVGLGDEGSQAALRTFNLTTLATNAIAAIPVPTGEQAVRSFNGEPVPETKGAEGNPRVKVIFDLFMKSVELYREEVGQNNLVAKIADIITKYVILDPKDSDPFSRFGFSIDIEAIILGFEERIMASTNSPTRESPIRFWPFTRIGLNVRPFISIGMNYAYASGLDSAFAAESALGGLEQVAFASEKIGLRWRWFDWKYTRGQHKGEWFKYHGLYHKRAVRPRAPMFNNMYVMVYGSGLLYTIADLRTDRSFNYALVGTGAGVTFFNGLELNASYAAPVIPNATIGEDIDAGFWVLGLDIPIFEYIRAARAKRGQ